MISLKANVGRFLALFAGFSQILYPTHAAYGLQSIKSFWNET